MEREPLKPSTRYMSPDDMRRIRGQLGLSLEQMSLMLDTDPKSLREIEGDRKNIAPRMARLLEAYAAGFLPDDWPVPFYDASR